jgi:hypothetical protein
VWDPNWNINENKRTWSLVQVVESWPSKREALSSNPSTVPPLPYTPPKKRIWLARGQRKPSVGKSHSLLNSGSPASQLPGACCSEQGIRINMRSSWLQCNCARPWNFLFLTAQHRPVRFDPHSGPLLCAWMDAAKHREWALLSASFYEQAHLWLLQSWYRH